MVAAPTAEPARAAPPEAPSTRGDAESTGVPPAARYFPEEGPAGGCASGECLQPPQTPAVDPPSTAHQADLWRAAVEAVKRASARHGMSLGFGRLVSLSPGEVTLAFPKESAFHRMVVSTSGKSAIEQALAAHFGRPTRVVLTDAAQAASAGLSIAEEDARARDQREKSTESTAKTHPAVRSVLRTIGGEIEHIRVLDPVPVVPALPDQPEEAP